MVAEYVNTAFDGDESRGIFKRRRLYDWVTWLLHIGLVTLAATTGLATCLGLGWTSRTFENGACLLYANMHLTLTTNGTRELLFLDSERSQWGRPVLCNFCTYANTTLVTYSVLWLWMYTMLHKFARKSRTGPNVRLLPVALVFNLILWVCTTVSLGFVNAGTSTWCSNVETSIGKPCSYLAKVEWLSIPDGHLIYQYSQIALVSSWLLFVTLSVNTVVMIVVLVLDVRRCPPDNGHKIDLSSVGLSPTT